MYCSTPLIMQATVSQKTRQNIHELASLINTAVTCSVIMVNKGSLLIRPLCLKQPGCGFVARCRLGHFAYHRRDFQLFVG